MDDIETDQTDAGLTAPPAVQTVEIDGRNGAIPSATDFLSQTAQTSEQVRGMIKSHYSDITIYNMFYNN